MKANNTFNVVIANEACNFTATKYNTTLTGFTSSEAANNAAREALRDIAGEMGKDDEVFYCETLGVWVLYNPNSGSWLLTAKVVKVETEEPATDTPANESEETELVHTSRWGDTDRFAVVNEFPAGAIVWSIGRHNFPFPGFIPVAWPLEEYTIDRSRLMAVKCKDDQTADAILKEASRHGVNAERFAELNAKQTETTVISLPRYYTETPERLRFLARNMADQYKGLNDPEAKRMKALYLDIAGSPEYFLKNNLIKAI